MKLPNAERAFIDEAKLKQYCLDVEHDIGRHKARVFRAVLQLGPDDVPVLAAMLQQAIQEHEVDTSRETPHGVVYSLRRPIAGSAPPRRLRSAWIVRRGEDFPRLVTCFLERGR